MYMMIIMLVMMNGELLFSAQHNVSINNCIPISYTLLPCPITYEQTHQLPPLNATLSLIISPLPSLPLDNSLTRTPSVGRSIAHALMQSINQQNIKYYIIRSRY